MLIFKNFPAKRILLLSTSFFLSFQISLADPFVEKCAGEECYYTEAEYNVYGCSGSDIVVYAIDPTSGDNCIENASFQWYTYDYYNTGSGWDYGWITVNGATSNRYEVTNHATLEYYCEVSCDGSTYNTDIFEVNYNSLPPSIISHPEDVEVCEGNEVFFEGLASGTDLEYQWQTKKTNGLWENVEGEISPEISIIPGLEDSDYSFRLMVSSSCALAVTASAKLTVNPNPKPDLGDDFHICEGTTELIGVENTFVSYSWNSGQESNQIDVSETGEYILSVSNDKNCSGSDSIQIMVDSKLPELDLGEDLVVCMGEIPVLESNLEYDNYAWNTGETGSSLTVVQSGEYWLTAGSDLSVCKTSDSVMVSIVEPFSEDNICMITTDPETGNNLIVWERTPDVGLLSYNVYRQSNILGEYDLIASLNADELSVFEDPDADPEVRQWVYKITAIDTCGNESDIDDSPYHIPLFLQYVSSDNGVNLRWVPYEVENGNMNFVSYIIFRGSDSTKLENIAEISSDLTVYRDIDQAALENPYFYRVAGVRADACVPLPEVKKAGAGPFVHSLSNLEDNKLSSSTAVDFNTNRSAVKVFPNPVKDYISLQLDQPEKFKLLKIMDLSGKQVFEFQLIESFSHQIYLPELERGTYIMELKGMDVFRKRIVVE